MKKMKIRMNKKFCQGERPVNNIFVFGNFSPVKLNILDLAFEYKTVLKRKNKDVN